MEKLVESDIDGSSMICLRSEVTHRMTSVVASVAGEAGELLRVSQVHLQRQGWGEDKELYLEVPVLHGDEVTWDAQLGPVQQVCFAQPIDRGECLLAVRYLTKVLLVRPMYRKGTASGVSGSGISTELLYAIDRAGLTHADVAFNPWFGLQIAVIDQAGYWKVVEFSSRKLNRIARTWATPGPTSSSSKEEALYDGWARIAWVMNSETILVCVRRSIKLFSINKSEAVLQKTIDSELLGDTDWILDFQQDAKHLDCCYVLTSTYLILIQFRTNLQGELTGRVKARVRHHRNPEDLSMRLHIFEAEQGVWILISSRRAEIAFAYRFSFADFNHITVASPVQFDLPIALCEVLDLQIEPVSKIEPRSTDDHSDQSEEALYMSAFVLRKDRDINSTLLSSSSDNRKSVGKCLLLPTWTSTLSASATRLRGDNFVVDDAADGPTPLLQSTMPIARRARRQEQQTIPKQGSRDLELVASALRQPIHVLHAVDQVLESADATIAQRRESPLQSLHTLASLAKGEIGIVDVQQSSDLLEALGVGVPRAMGHVADIDAQLESEQHWKLGHVSLESVVGLEEDLAGRDLQTVYNRLVSLWITPLGEETSGWIRLAKVAIARSLAAEITLASRTLRLERDPGREGIAETRTDQGFDSVDNIPIRSQPASSPWAAKHSVPPTPSPTATPSVTTASSHRSSLAAPELYRLSKYTTFSKPSPMVLPRPLAKVLTHWEVGADPTEYNWSSTSKDIARQEEEEEQNEEMTEKERQRARRRAERHIRRQRKEAAASQAHQLASSQAPEILSASQPIAPIKAESQPSHITGSSQSQNFGASASNIASQVVPGRFGGRPPPKKKRKSGF
ncbi:uncharacterized protein MYCFIDRAFT_76564 [Pseudocercospora fijiensis CIRAD86]|uniref:RNA polymerase I-specific transcription initiation factor RRN6-like protein n=1 Tax=Pseudocercospora fijiensis (strain CIRAD86) TaxID=383855 RepID=N1Q8J0_PSEFD|nr:uncharacterized protein MYCFIDRAFT_76564 [Pseudocercospora fijiensis CIRAD86]EME89210.1 hypothetical protein MYCFIDRAFT_76564 [Pseudocercospora fijiensis CIRAD86]